MNRALGREWQFRVRQPDEHLAAGAADGYNAGLQKPFDEEFADLSLNSDGLLTVPAFEMARTVDGSTGRGRQIFQFAAVQLGTTYAIELLPTELGDDPAAVTVTLVDEAGEPLAGGAFRLHADRDGDGVLGLVDELVPGGTCVTTTDGTGDCEFDTLDPGPYVVEQTDAPPGFAPSPDRGLFLEPGERSNVTFTNVAAIASIETALTDDASPPAPLAGGVFEIYSDDGDGVLGDRDRLFESCATDGDGGCAFPTVPLGAYVVHERTAPADHVVADDAGFALTAPGQVAKLSVVNGLVGLEGTEGIAGTEGEPPTEGSEEIIEEELPGTEGSVDVVIEDGAPLPIAQVEVEEIAHTPERTLLRRLLDVPGDVSRYLARHPFEAALFAAVWGLFGAAAVLAVRRRRLVGVVAATTAPSSPGPRI
jgi:hypothetical protein